jgi:hypothetical protein
MLPSRRLLTTLRRIRKMDCKLDLKYDAFKKHWQASLTLATAGGGSITRHAFSKDNPAEAAGTVMREVVGEAVLSVLI